MSAKDIVKKFYSQNLATEDQAMHLMHPDCELNWHSSKGYKSLDYNAVDEKLKEIRRSYESWKFKISHLLEDKKQVTIRYTIYATSIERPNKEQPLAHFITIWQVKEGKLYKGFEISQLADDSSGSLSSFTEIKV